MLKAVPGSSVTYSERTAHCRSGNRHGYCAPCQSVTTGPQASEMQQVMMWVYLLIRGFRLADFELDASSHSFGATVTLQCKSVMRIAFDLCLIKQ